MELIRSSSMEDVEYLSKHLRVEDVEEVEALNVTPFDALAIGLRHSTVCFTIIDPKTGLPCAMAGIAPAPHNPDLGVIWLLGTVAIEQNTVTFLRRSRPVMEALFQETPYKAVYNYTHANNIVHHRWLKWLGFVFLRKVTFGDHHQFYEVIKIRS